MSGALRFFTASGGARPWSDFLRMYCLVLVFFCCCAQSAAQIAAISTKSDRDFQRIGTEHGLSNSYVEVMLQDSKGFMWFGTSDGLNKYDGYEFTVYKPDRSNPHSITDNTVTALLEASDGLLWMGTSEGKLCSFDRRDEKFTTYSIESTPIFGTAISSITGIVEDQHRKLWLTNYANRFFCFDPDSGVFSEHSAIFRGPRGDEDVYFNVESLLADGGGVWIGTSKGLLHYQPYSGRADHYPQPSDTDTSLYHTEVISILKAAEGKFIVLTKVGLYSFDPALETFTPLLRCDREPDAPPLGFFHVLAPGSDGSYWIGTIAHGLYQFLPQSNKLIHHEHHPLYPNSLSSNSIFALEVDRFGTLWAGTRFGVNKLSVSAKNFRTIGGERAFTQGMRNRVVRALCHDRRGYLWIGTDGGPYYIHDSATEMAIGRPKAGARAFYDSPVNAIYEDSYGWIWIGYSNLHQTAYHPDKGEIRQYAFLSDSCRQVLGPIYCFAEDHEGRLWTGTRKGLRRFDRDADRFEEFGYGILQLHRTYFYVFDILEVENGILWLATNEGLYVFNTRIGRYIRRYTMDAQDSSSISSNETWCLHRDRRGRIWVGTFGQGINLYDPQSDSFRSFNEAEGLPSGATFGILEDDRGRLWISTARGLSRFDPRSGIFRNYDVQDGLQSNAFYFGAYHHSKYSGEMFFGGENGVNRFHPDSVRYNPHEPLLAITELQVSDSTWRREMLDGDSLNLSYRDNFITFTFAALDYNNPGKHQYRYMLEGVDDKWVECGTRRFAAYTKLPAGDYTFRLQGSNSDGVWNHRGITIPVRIAPPFWNTLLFRSGVALLLIALVGWGAHRWTKAVQRKADLKRQVLESELEALRLQMNPHFMFNSLHSIQHFIIKHDQDTAYTYLARFASLMRMTLENSRKQEISLARELMTLELYLELETLRFGHKIRYVIDLDCTIDSEQLMLPPMLLQPFVENAIVHGLQPKIGPCLLTIAVRRQGDQIVCTVEDNGVGRTFARRQKQKNRNRHLSIGMKVARKRLERLTAQMQQSMSIHVTDLFDAHGQASGTRVDITLAASEISRV